MTRLLLDSEMLPEQREHVEVIYNSGRSLLTILNDILDFSKIESGNVRLEKEPFRLAQVIENANKLFAHAATRKGIDLSYAIQPTVPTYLIGDQTRLLQILVNLLGNAIKFTAQGSIVLTVVIDHECDDLCTLHLSVCDSGIGIAPEVINLLFHPFSQVDLSTTRKYGGTGLGLAICKRLCELMKGSIWVESKVGQGSTFHVTVQFEKSSKPSHLPSSLLEPMKPALKIDSSFASQYPYTILVVEDNIVNQKVITHLLLRLGYQTDVVCNGREAVAAVQKQCYDLILMDIQMPEMDGLEATRRIRSVLTERQQPTIIAISAAVTLEEQKMVVDTGMDAFVSKPINIDELTKCLRFCHSHAAITN